ncbi:MAG: hypothetical protein H6831_00925 [Planctomycetes bacterium]|nr:hypothetical protein [Planctomycetota bacterium]
MIGVVQGEGNEMATDQAHRTATNRELRVAFACWVIPLVVGLAAFGGWLAFGLERWSDLGMIAIAVGLALFVLGFVFLLISIRRDRLRGGAPSRRVRPLALICAGLLISNFPIALAMAAFVIHTETRYTVVVRNQSQQTFDEVQVVGGGIHSAQLTLLPGGTNRFEVWPKQDGALELELRSAAREESVVVEGYVTNLLGGDALVTIRADGSVGVEHPKD